MKSLSVPTLEEMVVHNGEEYLVSLNNQKDINNPKLSHFVSKYAGLIASFFMNPAHMRYYVNLNTVGQILASTLKNLNQKKIVLNTDDLVDLIAETGAAAKKLEKDYFSKNTQAN